MAEPSWNPGSVVWRELLTRDVERAKGFYAELLGWSWSPMAMGGGATYWIGASGDRQVAGAMQLPELPGGRPAWVSYVSSPDVDAAVSRARAGGGAVCLDPMDVPEVGRVAMVASPDGAAFGLFRALQGDEAPPAPPGPGTFCWETVSARDAKEAGAFYGDVLGWKLGPGPTGPGSLVFLAGGGAPVADLQAGQATPPAWTTYVVVGDVDASARRAGALGGQVVVPRLEVPGIGSIAVVADPGGALIGLFQPRR